LGGKRKVRKSQREEEKELAQSHLEGTEKVS
jgi:hypothetical protein